MQVRGNLRPKADDCGWIIYYRVKHLLTMLSGAGKIRMVDEKNLFEAGIAKTQIEAARRRLSRNEKLDDLHQECISYPNESLIALSLLLLVISLAPLLLYSNTSVLVPGLLTSYVSSLLFLVIKTFRRKLRIRESRSRDVSRYDN